MSKQVYSNLGDFGDGLEFSISKPNKNNMDTEILKVGTYLLPDDCTVSVVKGKVIVHQKRRSFLKEDDHRCKDCEFFGLGNAFKNAWYQSHVCHKRPKGNKEGIFYAVSSYGKSCELFQRRASHDVR